MSKVVGLRGAIPLEASKEPDADVVKFIDALMQEALSGQLRGIAIVTIDTIGSISTDWSAHGVERHLMLAGASILNHRICAMCAEDDDE